MRSRRRKGEDTIQWILDENKVVARKPGTIISINGAVAINVDFDDVCDATISVISHNNKLIERYNPRASAMGKERGRQHMNAKDGVPIFSMQFASDDVVMVGVVVETDGPTPAGKGK